MAARPPENRKEDDSRRFSFILLSQTPSAGWTSGEFDDQHWVLAANLTNEQIGSRSVKGSHPVMVVQVVDQAVRKGNNVMELSIRQPDGNLQSVPADWFRH